MNLPQDDNSKGFIEHVRKHTNEYGIRFIITKTESLNLGGGVGRCAGFFDSTQIKVAGNTKAKLLGIIVHEYAHFLQFINNEDVWKKSVRNNLDQLVTNSKNYSKSRITSMIQVERNLEIDAEKKAVALIKKYSLPLDKEEYIKSANAYIYFFTYIHKYRRWCKKAPSRIPKILDIMPVTFRRKYDTLPEDYEKLVNRYCV